jgi:hypothetical protein
VPVGTGAAILDLGLADSTDDGSYTLTISSPGSPCGAAITTCPITVTVVYPPYFAPGPTSQTVCSGDPATATSTPGGTGPFDFVWKKGTTTVHTNLNAYTSTYTIPVTVPADAGIYSVTATNDCGSVTYTGDLIVNEKPVITAQPVATKTVCEETSSQSLFTFTASGTPTPTYTWYGPNSTSLVAGTDSTLQMVATTASTGVYFCKASNGCPPDVTSNLVSLTVNTPPVITGQPLPSMTVCAGSTMQSLFTFNATGESTPIFTWYGPNSGSTIAGTGSTLEMIVATAAKAGDYFCKASTGCPPDAVSNTVHLFVNSAPAITGQPSAMTVCENSTTQDLFSCTASGTPTPTYAWYKTNAGSTVFGTGSTLNMVVSLASAGTYYCKASNSCSPDATSGFAVLTVNEPPKIAPAGQPHGITVCQSDVPQVLLTAQATGTPPLTYTWYGPGSSGYPIAGAGPTLSKMVSPSDAGTYYVKVTNACNPTGLSSDVVALLVNPQPVVTVSVAPDPITTAECGAADVTLTANASQATTPFVYKWFKDSAGNQVGGNSPTLHLGAVQQAATYWVEVTSADGCAATSDVIPLATGQDGLHAQWMGSNNSSLLQYGLWQRLNQVSQACGNWNGTAGAFGVCPPPGFGRLKNSGGAVNTAVLEDGDAWTMEQLEIEGLSTSAQQRLSIRPNAELQVEVCATIKSNGLLGLAGGAVSAGLVTVKSGGVVEGYGQLATTGSIDNFGEIRSAGSGLSQQLELALSSLDPTLHNHPGAFLRAPAASGRVRVLGSLENGIAGVPSGTIDVQANAELSVTETVFNYGLTLVSHSGAGFQGNLGFKRFENRGAVATCASCSPLLAGVWLQGGRLTSSGGVFENYPASGSTLGAKLHGYGTVLSDVWNSGKVKVTGPASSALYVSGCFTNTSTGVVQIDAGTTLTLNNAITCPTNLGTIAFTGLGTCSGCATVGSTLVMQGDFENGPGAQLQLDTGLVQVLGHFHSEITEPYAFDLSGTRVELNGYGFDGPQELSLAGPNLGSIGDYDAQKALALGELVVGPTPALVVLVPKASGGSSVLYVKHLEVSGGATLELGDSTVFADEVVLDPGAQISLSAGKLYYGSINLPAPCSSGQILGAGCATQLVPMPAPDCNGNGTADSLEIAANLLPDCNGNGVPDACDITLGSSLDQDLNAVPDDCQSFHADRPWISAAQGGKQVLGLHAGAAHGNQLYVVVGSATGTAPGLSLDGVAVPLNLDSYTLLTLNSLNKAPFGKTFGLLDPQGRATATIELEAGQLGASVAGAKFHHAYVALSGGAVVLASNPTSIEIRP